jgi:hypothetical protein
MAYTGSVELISGIKQKNGQDFPLVDASAVRVDDETRLDDALSGLSADVTSTAQDVDELSQDLSEISENSESQIIEIDVPLNLTDVRVGQRCSDSNGTSNAGVSLTVMDSSVTTCIVRAFICEANKTYKLIITNGVTPAQIASRGTVVVCSGEQNLTIEWGLMTTNTANAQDVIEFTPPVSGSVLFNVDKNFQSVSVTTEETTATKTAKDAVARGNIRNINTALETINDNIDALDEIITGYSTSIEKIDNIESTVDDLSADIDDFSQNLSEISEDLSSSEEEIEIDVPLNLSDIRVGQRCSDSNGTSNAGVSLQVMNSSVTTCIVRAFVCEANKTYKLTITNGATPAKIASRGTVVVCSGDDRPVIEWGLMTTNTANATDVVEFTPPVSGQVFFNLDMNYQSITVTTTIEGGSSTKTAKDIVARNDIRNINSVLENVEELTETVETVTENIEELTETVGLYSDEIGKIIDITETFDDGTTVEDSVELDMSDVRAGSRSSESGNLNVGSSSVTTCIVRAFVCEANKTYKLTITNGATPAKIADRATVVTAIGEQILTVADVFHSTNTANAKDVLEFTPTVSGYVFFNVDMNFQSVSVTEMNPNIVTTAIDYKARALSSRGGIIRKEITWESGTFDASLADISGNGYRSNIISGVNGCVVCIKVNPSYSFVYGDGISLTTIYGIYVIRPQTDSIRIGLSDTIENVGFEMRIYKECGLRDKYDVIVAASDSMPEDKAKADIVCDGTNDELDLQFAVNWNFGRKRRSNYNDFCNVFLMPGTYNIDNFTQQYTANGQLTRETYAVMIGNIQPSGNMSYTYRVGIEGAYTSEHNQNDSSTVILVSNTGSASLSSEVLNALFGVALLSTGSTGSIHSCGFSVDIKNLHICTGGVTNNVIAIDAYQAGNVIVENCDIHAALSSMYMPVDTMNTIPEGSIGIRAGRGSCLGVRQSLKGNRIQGFYEGIALCGEHFICQDNLEIACVYAFTLNNYTPNGAVQHPNIFIGNSIEQCLKMGKLLDASMRCTLIYIGGSVENKITLQTPAVEMLPFEITSNTLLRGRIESDSLASPYNESFFYDGYGSTFEQTVYPFYQA